MRNLNYIPKRKMIQLLKAITTSRIFIGRKKTNCIIASLLNRDISMLNNHFILSESLVMKTNSNLSTSHHALFRLCIEKIFSLFFTVKGPYKFGNKPMAFCVLKRLPNFRLYLEGKKIMHQFFVEEENKFKISEISKKYFLLNSFLDDGNEDDNSETLASSKNEENGNSLSVANKDQLKKENMN